MVRQYVAGLQGKGPIRKVSATCKHTFGYQLENWEPRGDPSQWPDSRATSADNITKQDMLRYYLRPFEACVAAGSAGMMCSYNMVNGVPTCADGTINNEFYRARLGWEGFIVSDCGAITDMFSGHHFSPDLASAAGAALRGGCDTACDTAYDRLPQALQQRAISTHDLDTAAMRILREQIRQGELDEPRFNPYKWYPPWLVDSPQHRALAVETAQQAITLLVNKDELLPLGAADASSIAFIGPHANTSLGMLGNYFGGNKVVYQQTPLLAARRAGMTVEYAAGVPCWDVTHGDTTYPLCDTENTKDRSHVDAAVRAARRAKTVVLFLGNGAVNNSGPCAAMDGVEGEGCDRGSIELPESQRSLLWHVSLANRRVVVVLINGGAIAMPSHPHVAALLEAYYPGEMAGEAIVNVLWGKSDRIFGRLPYMVPQASFTRERDFRDMSMRGGCGITHQWYKRKPQFPFGFGLSYTTFAFTLVSAPTLHLPATPGASVTIACVVANTGGRGGDAVVFAFVLGDGEATPLKQLFHFRRVALGAGANATVEVEVLRPTFERVDEHGGREVVSGRYVVQVGDVERPTHTIVVVE